MKYLAQFFLTYVLLVVAQISHAQCVLSATDDTEAEVLACLTACGCIEAQVPTGITIAMAEAWDLTSAGAIQITIQGSGSIEFSGSGANADEIFLAAGSQIIIEDVTNTDALTKASGGNGNVRVTIGGDAYNANDFVDIIDNGGVDENWPAPPGTPLPVELVFFKGRRNQKGVQLSWQTASELNNEYFEVELADDGENYTAIAKLDGAGTTTALQNYEWLHGFPMVGLNYYRLKQVDFDGQFEYSDIIVVQNDTAIPLYFAAYPQPASHLVKIDVISSDNEASVKMDIINSSGQIINKFNLAAQQRSINLDISGYQNGIYLIRLVQSSAVFNGKLLIQH